MASKSKLSRRAAARRCAAWRTNSKPACAISICTSAVLLRSSPACWTRAFSIPSSRGWCSPKSKIRNSGGAVICGSITQNDSFTRFRRIFRKLFGTTPIWSSPTRSVRCDDFLNPKWKGKIGYLDPRTPGAGDSTWSFMWQVKGEEYLKKLVAQDLYLGRDQRVLAESLAKGRVAVMIGNSYYSYLPFLKAGLPIKTLPTTQRGKLRHRRQRQSGDHQSAGAPEQHQGFRQLAVGPRGTGDRFQSARSSDPAPRCRYPLSERIRHDRGERRDVGQ